MQEKETKKQKNNQKSEKKQGKKGGKKRAVLIIIFSLLALAIGGVIIWVVFFKTKSCSSQKTDETIVHVVQPNSSKWELTVNGKKDDFSVKENDELNCVVKAKASEIDFVTNDAVIYYIQVRPLKDDQEAKIYPFELSFDEATGTYSSTFSMYWKFSISISITSSSDFESSYYTLDEEGNVDSYYKNQTLFDENFDSIEKINVFDMTSTFIKKTEFDEEFYVGSKIESVLPGFLCYCVNFNSPIHFEKCNKLQSISRDFLWKCFKFNQPLNFPDSVKTIDGDFMYECKAFNQEFNTNKITTMNCPSFMYGCTSFNNKFTIGSSLTAIPSYFLSGCTSFNQPLTIPENIKSINDGFMIFCDSMVSNLTINCPVTAFSPISNSENVCSTNNTEALCATQGIIIDGANGSIFKESFPDLPVTGETKMFRCLKLA